MVVFIFDKTQKKTILFVGGGVETLPGVKLAKSMGLNVVVSDINPNAPCITEADDFIVANTYDVRQTIESSKKFHETKKNINAVICMASDVPLTVAAVASELKLPGIPLESAKIVMDKVLMKDRLKRANLPIPKYKELYNLAEFENELKSFKFPLIIKPVDSRGARGVIKVTENVDLEWAYLHAKSFSPSGRVLIEQYLEGPQISTEALVIDKKVFTIGFSDRNYEFLEKYAPFIIENGGDLPSHLNQNEQNSIIKTFEKTARALNINNGVIKGDMVLSKGDPYIIEVATRLSGGYFCSHEIPLNTGVDFVGNAIKLALGDRINKKELVRKFNKPVCQRYFFPKPGKVINISIPNWIINNKKIKLFEIRVKVGDIISEPTDHPARAGVVVCIGETSNEARQISEKVIKEVLIETKL